MKYLLFVRYSVFGYMLIGTSVLFGAVRILGTGNGSGGSATPADWLQGGVAVAAIGFAGAVVKFMGGMLEKERARGDRLEASLVDKALPAISASAAAMTSLQAALTQLGQRGS